MKLVASLACILIIAIRSAFAAQYTDSAYSYSLTYPDSWHTIRWPRSKAEVVLRSFPDDETLQGGDPPSGGAQIHVNAFPPYWPNWPPDADDYEHLHAAALHYGTIISEATRVSGSPAHVKWIYDNVRGYSLTNVDTVVRPNGRIFYIGLEYWTDDPAGPEYERILSDVVASLTASPVTPSGSFAWSLLVPPELLVPNPAAGKRKPKEALWAPQVEPDPPPGEPTPEVDLYLIRPPDPKAPLRYWEELGVFYSEAECRAAMQEKQRMAPDKRALRQLHHAQCIREDDLNCRIKAYPEGTTPANVR